MKKKTVSSVKKRVWCVFSKYIRLRDCMRTTGSLEYAECISCNETKPYHLLDAGHFRPKHNGNYFSEKGVQAQCRKCNRFKGGMPLEYRRALVELYGEGVDLELEAEAREIRKYTIKELEALEEDLKAKIKEL